MRADISGASRSNTEGTSLGAELMCSPSSMRPAVGQPSRDADAPPRFGVLLRERLNDRLRRRSQQHHMRLEGDNLPRLKPT